MEQNPPTSSSFLGRRKKTEKKAQSSLSFESFPLDDPIIDILSKLPAQDVLRSRCVCRSLRDKTSTREFTDLHRPHSFPMILKNHDLRGRALLDRCWEPTQTRSKIHKFYEPKSESPPYLSHNGLVVAMAGKITTIYNPIYHDAVTITVPLETLGTVYGVFFHPVLKEYCTLWRIILSLEALKVVVQYRILNLESNPQWRDIGNPYTQSNRTWYSPILIDKYVYWMVEPCENSSFGDSTFNCNIMEYDIVNEEFRAIPCPIHVNNNKKYNVNLIDIDGVASLVKVFPSQESVEIIIWTLKDQLWTSSHYIVSSDVYHGYGVLAAVAYWNEELVIQSDRRLYVCNIKLGTFRKFGRQYEHSVKFSSHVTSLVSLRNCKSEICMTVEDEKNLCKREGLR